MNSPSPHQISYLIIGAGVFGVSTALHLIQKYPSARITLLDRDAFDAESRVAASWDWNKVVRADYDDLVYCKLALEAQEVFLRDPLWKPFFHRTGIYWLCRDEYAGKVCENYRGLGREGELRAVPVREAGGLFEGVFGDADQSGVREVLVNEGSGWAEAGDCLVAVTRRALELGVRYVVGETEALGLSADGSCCTGVRLATGELVTADRVILSTGAYTPKLLELSAHAADKPALSAGSRIVAAGITTGMTTLSPSDYPTYASMPVGVQGYTPALGPFIGSLPPTKNHQLKWWGQTIFTNEQEVLPGKVLSAPPAKPDYAQWEVSERLREDIRYANHVFYGAKTKDWKMEKHRICWDAFTTSADFIISPHSAARNLYVATCGNFHGWKFFPVLGKYIVQMLENELEPELREKWAWDRERPKDGSENADYPRHEMRDLMDVERRARL